MQILLQVLAFLVANRSEIIEIIKSIEELIPDAPGQQKSSAVRDLVANALGVGDSIEKAWPTVQPIFNLLVSAVKGK